MISRRSIAAALLSIAMSPTIARACSPAIGVDPDAFIRAIALPGRVTWGISAAAALVWLIATRKPANNRSIALLSLALLNPGLWLWGIGDCGTLAFELGGGVALLSVLLLAHGLWARRAQNRTSVSNPGV